MKILVVSSMWPDFAGQPGYSGLFVKEQVEALRTAGHDVEVELLRAGQGLWGLITSHIRFVAANRRIRRRAVEDGFDVVHAHSGSAGLSCLSVRRSVPFVLTHHGEQLFKTRFGQIPFLRWIDRFVARRAARMIVVSDRLAATYADARPAVIPCGISDAFFADLDQRSARLRLGLDTGSRYVMFAADPARAVKNYPRFQRVLAAVADPNVRELILFDPSRPRDAVPSIFAAVDALLLTSNSEGSPQVVKEAICSCLPVVATDVGDVRDLLTGISPGGVVSIDTGPGRTEDDVVAELAKVLTGVLATGERSNGDLVRSRYSNAHSVALVEEVYRDAVGSGRAGRTPAAP